MNDLQDVEREQVRFRSRLLAAAGFVLAAFAVLLLRLTWLQVVRHEELATQAEANRITVVPVVPNRGQIVDRNHVVLATNYSAYTLEIAPARISGELDPTIDALATVIDIQSRDRRRFRRLLEEAKGFESLPIRTRLSDEEVARFLAQRFRFPGVEIRARLFRNYPFEDQASHLLGYIGRINQAEKAAMEDWDEQLQANYRGTEYIGKLGLEQSYEGQLHGSTGYEEVETSAGGRAVRRIRSHAATPGNTLVLSVDMKLQQIVESLYGDRRGALVALDPRNGEVLAFVSKPTFDPNLFVDGIDADNWRELNESIDKPLLNRGLRGTYAPGSTYKPYMALAALTTGKRTPEQTIHDPGYFWFGNHKFRDDKEGGHGAVDMYRSIVQSCDTYYYMLANDLGVDTMAAQLAPFGFGQITGIDMEGELRGVLPSTEWKKRAYRKPEQQRWYAGETISLGIGQGYNSFTVLQMAQAVATLAAGGIRHKPHLVHEIVDVVSGKATPAVVDPGTSLGLKPEHLAIVHDAMVGVNREGTSATAFLGAAYVAAGKTGTAQVVGIKADEKYSASKVAEHLRDHALFIAYAPADKPTVALALVVENAGFGAQAAAPIARRVFDYLLTGQVPTDDDIAAVAQGLAPAPPRPGASAVAAAGAIAAAASGASAAVLSRPVAPAAVAARTPVAAAVR